MSGRTGKTGTSGISSVLELCQKKGIFRNSSVYEAGAIVRILWYRNRGE